MRQHALLRSDKGLGIPGTARKKSEPTAVPAIVDDRKDHFVVRNGVRCAGVHLIIDLYEAEGLADIDRIEEALRKCVAAAGATLLHIHLHHFQPSGVSGVAVLAESHISIHTWPERGYAAVDIFLCARWHDVEAGLAVIARALHAAQVDKQLIARGPTSASRADAA